MLNWLTHLLLLAAGGQVLVAVRVMLSERPRACVAQYVAYESAISSVRRVASGPVNGLSKRSCSNWTWWAIS